MPLYEFWCPHCQRRFTVYVASFSESPPACPKCNENDLERRFSTFSVSKTSKNVYEGILNDTQLKRSMLRNDPKALAEWNRRMSGGEKAAPEYQETIDRMEHGEMPTEPFGESSGKSAPPND